MVEDPVRVIFPKSVVISEGDASERRSESPWFDQRGFRVNCDDESPLHFLPFQLKKTLDQKTRRTLGDSQHKIPE